MTPSLWTPFARWFVVLLLVCVAANLAGIVRPMGLKPFRQTGFPLTVAVWGTGVEEFFDWWALAGNALIAVAVSALIAYACAKSRRSSGSSR